MTAVVTSYSTQARELLEPIAGYTTREQVEGKLAQLEVIVDRVVVDRAEGPILDLRDAIEGALRGLEETEETVASASAITGLRRLDYVLRRATNRIRGAIARERRADAEDAASAGRPSWSSLRGKLRSSRRRQGPHGSR